MFSLQIAFGFLSLAKYLGPDPLRDVLNFALERADELVEAHPDFLLVVSYNPGYQSLAKELGPRNIRVNAILPGIVDGPRMTGVIRDRAAQLGISYEAMEEQYLSRVSLRRMVSPHDVASMVAFLLSDAGVNISGQSLGVDGNVETL